MYGVNRRDFAGMLVGAAALATITSSAEAQSGSAAAGVGGDVKIGPAVATPRPMKELTSGVFKPQPGKGMVGGHESHQFLAGMLTAGNIRLEMHESVQQPGASHEPVGTHKHSEMWLVRRGTGTLYLNGTEHAMEAGDVGLCCAGDEHWIANKGDTQLAYFVVTVGPLE